MIRIGFDDDKTDAEFLREEEEKERILAGDTSIDYETKIKNMKLPYFSKEREEEFLKNNYDCVVVNSFYNDDYDLSEEEREEKNSLYKVFAKVRTKRICRKLDEFVDQYRNAMVCLDKVAEDNGIYSKEKFMKLVLQKKILVTGLRFPKYKGKDRKRLDMDYVAEFILSDEESYKANPSYRDDNIIDDMTHEELRNFIFEPGELDYINSPPSEISIRNSRRPYDKDNYKDDENIVIALSPKESKKLLKEQPEIVAKFKEIRNDLRYNLTSSYIRDITYDDIDNLKKYDTRYSYKSASDIPEFKGDISGKDYYKYLNALDEYIEDNVKVSVAGSMKTVYEAKDIEFKTMLEQSGWNIRKFADTIDLLKKERKARKSDNKKIKQLKSRLLKIQDRQKRKMGEDFDDEDYKKDKKKKKKAKVKHIKDSDNYGKKNKKYEKKKKEIKDKYDDVLMSSRGRYNQTLNEWEDDALDFRIF